MLFSIYYGGSGGNILFLFRSFHAGNLTKGHFVTNLGLCRPLGAGGRYSSKFYSDLVPFTIPNSVQKKKLFDMVIPWVCLASVCHQNSTLSLLSFRFQEKTHKCTISTSYLFKTFLDRGIPKKKKIELGSFNKNQILDLVLIGLSLGFEGELIWAGLDISSELVNRLLIIMEGQRGLRRC